MNLRMCCRLIVTCKVHIAVHIHCAFCSTFAHGVFHHEVWIIGEVYAHFYIFGSLTRVALFHKQSMF